MEDFQSRANRILQEIIEIFGKTPRKCPKCKYVGVEDECSDCGEVTEVIGANSLGGVSGIGTGTVGM